MLRTRTTAGPWKLPTTGSSHYRLLPPDCHFHVDKSKALILFPGDWEPFKPVMDTVSKTTQTGSGRGLTVKLLLTFFVLDSATLASVRSTSSKMMDCTQTKWTFTFVLFVHLVEDTPT